MMQSMGTSELKKYYITFGFGQTDEAGNSLANCYTIVVASDKREATLKAIKYFGVTWSNVYGSRAAAGIDEHQLKLISYPKVKRDD